MYTPVRVPKQLCIPILPPIPTPGTISAAVGTGIREAGRRSACRRTGMRMRMPGPTRACARALRVPPPSVYLLVVLLTRPWRGRDQPPPQRVCTAKHRY